MTDDYRPDPHLEPEAIPVAALTVVSYIDGEGKAKYSVSTKGDAPMLTYLGMTVIAQREIEGWVNDSDE